MDLTTPGGACGGTTTVIIIIIILELLKQLSRGYAQRRAHHRPLDAASLLNHQSFSTKKSGLIPHCTAASWPDWVVSFVPTDRSIGAASVQEPGRLAPPASGGGGLPSLETGHSHGKWSNSRHSIDRGEGSAH